VATGVTNLNELLSSFFFNPITAGWELCRSLFTATVNQQNAKRGCYLCHRSSITVYSRCASLPGCMSLQWWVLA